MEWVAVREWNRSREEKRSNVVIRYTTRMYSECVAIRRSRRHWVSNARNDVNYCQLHNFGVRYRVADSRTWIACCFRRLHWTRKKTAHMPTKNHLWWPMRADGRKSFGCELKLIGLVKWRTHIWCVRRNTHHYAIIFLFFVIEYVAKMRNLLSRSSIEQ